MLLVTTVYLLSLVVWVGGIVFFSFIGAPSIFKALPPEYAGKAVGAIFPKYYSVGYVSGLIALACLFVSAFRNGSWPILKFLLIAFMILLTVWNSLVTHPKARALKEEMQIATSRTDIAHLKEVFDHVHRWSMINNAFVLFLGVLLIVLTARRLNL